MTAKRYIASDMSRALKKVREELGPDAIILSSKRVEQGVEIVASIDTTPLSPEKAAKKRFAESFDEELDHPLVSDTQWAEHHKAERIAANTKVAALKSAPVAKPAAAPAAQVRKPHKPTVAAMSNAASSNAERLAREIQAAHDRMLAAKAHAAESEALDDTLAHNRQVASFAQQVKARGIDDQKAAHEQKQLHSLYDEIAEMRMLLEEQLWQQQQASASAPAGLSGRARQLAGQLQQLGLPPQLTQSLLVCADDNERLPNCWRKALAMLAQRLPIDTRDPIEQGGTFAFVGPTGVGKTTTIAKLAARYVLNHGRGKVAIVTTDTYRVGAHDQLKALGRILQVPVRAIAGEHQLATVLAGLKQYPLVLIDTAGFRQGDPKLAQQEALLDACGNVQRLLVLAANSQQQILKASLHAYSAHPLRGCIFTKLDECASLGEAFGALCASDIPVLYSAAGQEIPDDIQVASSSDLIAQAVKLARQFEGVSTTRMDAAMGGL